MSKRAWFWLCMAAVFVFFIYLTKEVALPFVVGLLLAYLLDPVADRLERNGCGRTLASVFILLIVFCVVVLGMVLVVPALLEQTISLSKAIPEYLYRLTEFLQEQLENYGSSLSMFGSQPEIADKLMELSGVGFELLGGIVKQVWQSGMALFNVLSLLLITPVVAFYLLRDWDKIILKLNGYLPRAHASTVRGIFAEIDRVISGFIHGQLLVSTLLGIFYAVGLSLVGLDSALLIGFGTGVLTIIPYVGMLFGGAIGIVVAIYQFGDVVPVLMVLAVFAVGQFLEGNFIAPKLIGDKVGLHPVWIIFGMLVGASLLGLLGVLLAIPITATLGVLIRFGLEQYKQSDMYKEQAVTAPPKPRSHVRKKKV